MGNSHKGLAVSYCIYDYVNNHISKQIVTVPYMYIYDE